MWTGPYSVIDLKGTWMDGRFVAAAEIHHIGDKYYLAGTWNDHNHLIENIPRRYNVPTNQTQILVADSPDGPFKPLVPEFEFCLGPGDWDIIDGTLYQEDGTTYMVFVHEWTQIIDGTMDYMPLSKDLTRRTAEPTTIFRASEAPWSKEMNSIGEATFGLKMPGWVTDGPQMFRTQTGKLGMLWSSWGEHRYAQGVAYSTSGSIKGPWVQEKEALQGRQLRPRHALQDVRREAALHHPSRGRQGPAQAADLECRRFGRHAGARGPIQLLEPDKLTPRGDCHPPVRGVSRCRSRNRGRPRPFPPTRTCR